MTDYELCMYSRNAILCILGIGDDGCQAIQYIQAKGQYESVTLIAIDSDADRLAHSMADKIVLVELDRFTYDDKGTLTATAKDYLSKLLCKQIDQADAVFIFPGFRTPQSSLLSLLVCQLIVEKFKLETSSFVMAIVNEPGQDEGLSNHRTVRRGYEQLRECCDSVILNPYLLPKQPLTKRTDIETDSLTHNFETCYQVVKAITDLVIYQGLIGIDFSDVANVFRRTVEAIFSLGVGNGEDRAAQAIHGALADLQAQWGSLSQPDINSVLINIRAAEMSLHEFNVVGNVIHPLIADEAYIKIGTTADHTIPTGEMQVAVFLTKIKNQE